MKKTSHFFEFLGFINLNNLFINPNNLVLTGSWIWVNMTSNKKQMHDILNCCYV